MTKLRARLLPRSALSDGAIADMYALYASYYDATSSALFKGDLASKTHVIELRETEKLRGFSTIELIAANGYAALFSGDTVIHHEYWGEQELARAFCEFAGRVKAANAHAPLYWFLISKGYRTYRYLHLFSHAYYPNFRTRTPPELQVRLDALAAGKFGDAYDRTSGLIRFAQSRGHLRAEWAGVREGLRERPEIGFFLARNPRYDRGEELACITELELANLRSFAKGAFTQGLADASGAIANAA